MMRKNIMNLVGAALCALTASQAVAQDNLVLDVPVEDLIEEQLGLEVLDEMPPDGEIRLRLPEGLPERGERLEGFIYDAASGMFASRLIYNGDDQIGFRGQAIVLVPAYVPIERIQAGEILQKQDLKEIMIPYQTVPAGSLRYPSEVIGKQTRRVLIDNRPIPESSLIEPQIVERGDKVTIELASGGLKLIAPGKAMEDGAEGDDVRVINLNSNKTINATIEAPGLVRVAQ
jgi:flagella basal body P-ring formation protein FlgA